jgi:single-strand DNA-binding protein
MSVSLTILIGRVGKDPESSVAKSGMKIVKFSLATENYKKETSWHRITTFGKLAEIVEKYVRKGSQIYIEGEINYSDYEKDGVKQYFTDIIGNKMKLLGAKGDSQPTPQSTATHVVNNSSSPNVPDNSDDSQLPF